MQSTREYERIPDGEVTFLFTDIEGSTRLAQRYPDSYTSILERHNEILSEAATTYNGFVFKTMGDAYCISFDDPGDAINAAVQCQRNIETEEWACENVRVRMGLHKGEATWSGNDYAGYLTLSKVQRIMSSAHGGQIILSEKVIDNVKERFNNGLTFKFLGERRLKDLVKPEKIYQLTAPGIQEEFPPLKTLDERGSNLPLQPTRFIGRKKELKNIRELMQETRLLTLLGSGGTGKTRLSIETGKNFIDEFPGGVWFAELAQLTDPSLVVRQISSVFKISTDEINELIDFLKEKELLLILDNCEHLLHECARVCEKLLHSCAGLKILTTSRTALQIYGELTYMVSALELPDLKNIDIAAIMENEAVKLFNDRALMVKNDFKITDENVREITELCHKLDGIPLAIELAAARIRVLSPGHLLEKISDRFRILKSGNRAGLPKHQTLRAMIDWSYELLSEDEKLLFERLSVFSGGWTLEAAEEICSDERLDSFEVLDLLGNLVQKSLVISGHHSGRTRFRMLETIKEYSLYKFNKRNASGSAEESSIHERFYDHYYKLSKTKLVSESSATIQSFKDISAEFDNIRAAINHALVTDPERALRLANEMGECWEFNGNLSEGLSVYRKVFSSDIEFDREQNITGMVNAGFYASQFGEFDESIGYLSKAEALSIEHGDMILLSLVYNNLGNYYFLTDEYALSKEYHEKALKIGIEEKHIPTEGLSLVNLGAVSNFFGEHEEASKQYARGLEIFRSLNDRLSTARCLIQLAATAPNDEEGFKRAKELYEESIPILKECGDHIPISIALLSMGNLEQAQKKYDEAEELFRESLSLSMDYGYVNTIIHAQIKIAEIELLRGNTKEAASLLTDALRRCNSESDKYKISLASKAVAIYYFDTGRNEKAAYMFGITKNINKDIGYKKNKGIYNEIETRISKLKEKIGIEKFETHFNRGMNLESDEAIREVMAFGNQV